MIEPATAAAFIRSFSVRKEKAAGALPAIVGATIGGAAIGIPQYLYLRRRKDAPSKAVADIQSKLYRVSLDKKKGALPDLKRKLRENALERLEMISDHPFLASIPAAVIGAAVGGLTGHRIKTASLRFGKIPNLLANPHFRAILRRRMSIAKTAGVGSVLRGAGVRLFGSPAVRMAFERGVGRVGSAPIRSAEVLKWRANPKAQAQTAAMRLGQGLEAGKASPSFNVDEALRRIERGMLKREKMLAGGRKVVPTAKAAPKAQTTSAPTPGATPEQPKTVLDWWKGLSPTKKLVGVGGAGAAGGYFLGRRRSAPPQIPVGNY